MLTLFCSGANSSLYTSNSGATSTTQQQQTGSGSGSHQRTGSSSTTDRGGSSKHEQTEPMDFSSGQSFANFGAAGKGSFDGSTFGRSTSPSSELGRFRSSAGKE